MDRGGVGEAWVLGRGGGSVMVIAHEFADNRAYNGGMGVYTMFRTRHACESHVVFQFIPFETPPHLSLNHYLTHLQKNSSNPPHTANPPTNPLLPTHSLNQNPHYSSPSFQKQEKSRTAYLTNLTTKSRLSLPPTIHPSTQPLFELSSSPILPPFSAFPTHFSPFASSLNPLYHLIRITSSPSTTHRYPPSSTAAPSITKPTIRHSDS